MKKLNALWLSLALAFGFAAATVPAHAEQTNSTQPSSVEVSDETLNQFATALEEVRDIGQEYSEQVANAEGTEEAQQLQREAQEEMVTAVEDTGLSVQEYNSIAQLMSQDQELMERIEDMM